MGIRAESDPRGGPDEWEEAQGRLLAAWKEKQRVNRPLLAYDTTNFYTWTATTHQRNRLSQRGHNQPGRHPLRQVGLSYVLDGDNGLSLCHHVYAGNVADGEELPKALERILKMLDRNQMERSTVTLVFDKGTAALEYALLLKQAGVGCFRFALGIRRRRSGASARWKNCRSVAATNRESMLRPNTPSFTAKSMSAC